MVAWVVIDRQHLPRAARGPRQARKPCRLLASFPVLIPISHSSSPILLPTDRCPLTCPDRLGATAHSCFKSFRCNTYRPPRKCCKQKTYGHAKPFRCNTYKKHEVGVSYPFWNLPPSLHFPFFSPTYVEPILQPLCFDGLPSNGGVGGQSWFF